MLKTAFVIVNYHAGEYLARAIESALRYTDSDIYVVDNASTDTSVTLAQQAIRKAQADARVTWILNEENVGFAAANNQVLNSLDADIAILMNPDCELSSGVVSAICDTFNDNSDLAVLSCLIENSDGTLQKTAKRRFPTPSSALSRVPVLGQLLMGRGEFQDFDYGDQLSEEKLEIVEAVSGAFMAVKMDAATQVGVLDEAYFMHFEDLDWCKRFAQAGWQVGVLNEYRVRHAKGISSRSNRIKVLGYLHRSMLIFFGRYYRQDYHPATFFLIQFGVIVSLVLRSLTSFVRSLFNKTSTS
jgi:GT2 family glycosyltransferase